MIVGADADETTTGGDHGVVGAAATGRRRGGARRRAAAVPVPVRRRMSERSERIIDTVPPQGAITLRELAGIDVGRLRGVGERKRESLSVLGIETVLDLLTTYPRRWVDRTNEARVEDLAPGSEALVLVVGAIRVEAGRPQPPHDRRCRGRRRHGTHARRVLQPAVARAPAAGGSAGRPVRQGRHVPGRPADGQPGRRPDRRPHGPHRADLPAEREGADHDVGAGRVGRERTATFIPARVSATPSPARSGGVSG